MTTATQRIGLRLDRGIVLERLILTHVATLSANRAQAWLRSLLVLGFLAEIRLSHPLDTRAAAHACASSMANRQAIPGSAFATWLAADVRKRAPRIAPATALRRDAPAPAVAANDKPFAHLRKVVG